MAALRRIRSRTWSIVLRVIDAVGVRAGALVGRGRYNDAVAVIMLGRIGDFVLWIGAGEALRRHYAGQRVVLVGNLVWAGLAARLGIWDDVWSVHLRRLERNPWYRFYLVARLRAAGFGIAINPTHSRSFRADDALIRATAAPIRIGSSGDDLNSGAVLKRVSDRWYTRLVAVSPGDWPELTRHAEFLRGIGIEQAGGDVTDLREFAAAARNPRTLSTPYFVLVPGAGGSRRQWPLDAFAAVADDIAAKYELEGVICGTAAEAKLAENLRSRTSAHVSVMAGDTDLKELLAVVRDARLVVSNDTSVVHIAAALGTPCICLLGGGHFGRFVPYRPEWKSPGALPVAASHKMECFGCNWRCIYSLSADEPFPCIARIPAESIVTIADRILSGEVVPLDFDTAAPSGGGALQ